MSEQYNDKFSEASQELEDKSAFICKSCNRKYDKKTEKKKKQHMLWAHANRITTRKLRALIGRLLKNGLSGSWLGDHQ